MSEGNLFEAEDVQGLENVLADTTMPAVTRRNLLSKAAVGTAAVGIRVNAVSPGVIRTPMHAPDTHEQLAGLHPIGRIGEISDIVAAVRYLESAPFVTGEFLHVDGGQSAGH